MNDFTKEELHFISVAITDLLKRSDDSDYLQSKITILASVASKTNSMLANYCDHTYTDHFTPGKLTCTKCGLTP